MGKLRKSILVLGDFLFWKTRPWNTEKDTWPYLTRDFFEFNMCFRVNEVLP